LRLAKVASRNCIALSRRDSRGEHVILRLASPPTTVAGGKVLEPCRATPATQEPFNFKTFSKICICCHRLRLIAAEVRREGRAGTTLRRPVATIRAGNTTDRCIASRVAVVIGRSGLVVWKAIWIKLLARIPALLAPHAAGLSCDDLFTALPGTGATVLDDALARLRARDVIIERGKQYLIPAPPMRTKRAPITRRNLHRSSPSCSARWPDAAKPQRDRDRPTIKTRGGSFGARRRCGARRRSSQGEGASISSGRYRRCSASARAAAGARARILVTEIAAALGISRKYCMPLLDHLDTIKFTQRINDRRILCVNRNLRTAAMFEASFYHFRQ